jgi:predicted transcriptional regulator
MTPRDDPREATLPRALGPLEAQVLEAIWCGPRPATVRDLQSSFPRCAYTTLMTTVDRLHKKGVLGRAKVGRAYAYEPRFTRHELEARLATRTVEEWLGATRGRRALEPLLSCFVDAVSERDRLLLDDLERLLKAKRTRLVSGETP